MRPFVVSCGRVAWLVYATDRTRARADVHAQLGVPPGVLMVRVATTKDVARFEQVMLEARARRLVRAQICQGWLADRARIR